MPLFTAKSLKETQALAARLAKKIRGGGVFAFFGGMGMGKTAFIKAFVKALGNSADVTSPTFAIVNDYGGSPRIYHFDMYRIESWEDLYSTNFFEYINDGAIICIEWSENIENALPENAVRIEIRQGANENERLIKIEGRNISGEDL